MDILALAVSGGSGEVSLISCLPFALLLLAIALLPLFAPHFWEKNRNKAVISVLFGLPVAVYIGLTHGEKLIETAMDYGAFIALLGALFIVSGGIYIRGSFAGTPLINTTFLSIGALLASFLGTTGASMVLIRPLLRANQKRKRKTHIVIFFIFIVSNAGGLLTPLGDPPLFLGFLKGVPFEWTFQLIGEWAVVNAALLILFHFFDEYQFDKEDLETKGSLVETVQPRRGISLEGKINLLLLGGVVAVVFCSGRFLLPWALGRFDHFTSDIVSKAVQMILMGALAALSLKLTPSRLRKENGFSWHPIEEVAILFAGIFAAMIPPLLILNTHGASLGNLMGGWSASKFFWMTGALSSFLDNAPTYMTFSATAAGLYGIAPDKLGALIHAGNGTGDLYLRAIACGAVFMGANTYIGNGPNFMVKAIAEEGGVKMPGFFGYMKWSVGILVPLFALVTILFFRA